MCLQGAVVQSTAIHTRNRPGEISALNKVEIHFFIDQDNFLFIHIYILFVIPLNKLCTPSKLEISLVTGLIGCPNSTSIRVNA